MPMGSTYRTARIEEIPEVDDGRRPFRPVRQHLGIETFGVTTWTGREPGDQLINEHDEDEPGGGDELYLVLSGAARFELDGETVEAGHGTFVSVPVAVKRAAWALERDTTLLAIGGGAPGEVYEPSGWELWSPLGRLFEAGRHAELVERAQVLLEDEPRYGLVYYNVACSESLLGRTEDALAHLRRAIELRPALAEYARADEDLAALRDDPAFAEITAERSGG